MLDFRDNLMDLAIQANISDEKLKGMTAQIHAVAKASNQMQGDVTDALGAFVAKTGDIETARKNLELYAKTATATGASLKDVALIGVELSDKLGIKDQRNALGILAQQGRSGAVEIRDLASKAPKIFSAAASMFGVKGEEGLRGTGALAQVFAKGFGGTGSAASVSTSIENTFTDILKGQSKIEAAGIKVQGRDPYEVIKDLIRKTGGDPRQLLKAGGHGIFDVRAMRGINVMAREFKNTGGFKTFDDFKSAKGIDIDADVDRRMGTGASQLKQTQIRIAESADKNAGDKINALAMQATKLAGVFDWVSSHLVASAGIAIAAMTGWKLLGGVLSGAGGGGGVLGALGGGVQKVWVTNPGFGGVGGPGGGPGLLGKIGAASMAGAAGYAAGTYVDGKLGLSDKLSRGNGMGAAFENAAVGEHRAQLAQAVAERSIRVKQLEGQGMTHGQALYAADNRKVEVKGIVVNINDGKATVEVDGTRSADALVNRGKEARY